MKNKEYKPLGNRVIIKPIKETEEAKIGNIVLAESAIIFQKGEVVAVGRGEVATATGQLIEMELKPGDVVIYGKNSPYLPLMIGGEEHRLQREPDIEAVL